MRSAPWWLVVATAMILAPLGAAATRPTDLRGARLWVALWAALYLLEDLIAVPLALNHRNNHFITYIFVPLEGAAILWALSLWQVRQLARLTIRAAIPAFLVAWLLLAIFVEDVQSFSAVASPVYSLLTLAAALYTLMTRGSEVNEPLLRQDWFWMCGGLSLHFGALALLTPLGAALVKSHPDVVMRALQVRAFVNIVAYSCIAVGFLCPPLSPRSGPSFSPASSA